jgi:hypothetical protein
VRISRNPKRYRWCHHYAEHPEVADRLEALWHAWEAQWPDPEARLSWFRDGLDHELIIVMNEDGPLRQCSALENIHENHAPLRSTQLSASVGITEAESRSMTLTTLSRRA